MGRSLESPSATSPLWIFAMNEARVLLAGYGLTFECPGGHRVLEESYVQLREGENLALCGRNGAGKTTLLMILAGLLPATKGLIEFEGQSPLQKLADLPVALLMQNPDYMLLAPTVKQDLLLSAASKNWTMAETLSRIDCVVDQLALRSCLNRAPDQLSIGQRKRVALATLLLLEPRVLLLDEPTAGLDPRGRIELMGILSDLKKRGTTTLIASHDLAFLEEWADMVVLIEQKRLHGPYPKGDFFREGGHYQVLLSAES